ncbi:predicted protein [Streptomyces pristinaespiralis ATCC 25486]|uniref:Predicted protein n=1 Tax=Streptomyces pristinaespiralis (strain ATCC 25486 / DSM 40338 / CBS 914.69 / JCM 4507 / KCC S-0507 / NBRC 13074 / NRRL 2958 / 5647) TaxID=457429 RepID=D6X6A3_STRE2|nr:predicted protein [Streptomyces pristinaespiralis ATCC 25486]
MTLPRPPLKVALAASVNALPRGAGLAYEPKFDGHRMVIFRIGGDVLLQARSGRIVTAAFPDLAAAARELPEDTVLDGEVVVWRDGRTDFAAVQRRAAATAGRAPALARALPASYAAFDLLAEAGTDLRPLAYEMRLARLVAVAGPLGPPLQPVPMTLDRTEAEGWYESLPGDRRRGTGDQAAGPAVPGRRAAVAQAAAHPHPRRGRRRLHRQRCAPGRAGRGAARRRHTGGVRPDAAGAADAGGGAARRPGRRRERHGGGDRDRRGHVPGGGAGGDGGGGAGHDAAHRDDGDAAAVTGRTRLIKFD